MSCADVEYDVHDWNDSLFMVIRDTKRPNCELVVAPKSGPNEQTVSCKYLQAVPACAEEA